MKAGNETGMKKQEIEEEIKALDNKIKNEFKLINKTVENKMKIKTIN